MHVLLVLNSLKLACLAVILVHVALLHLEPDQSIANHVHQDGMHQQLELKPASLARSATIKLLMVAASVLHASLALTLAPLVKLNASSVIPANSLRPATLQPATHASLVATNSCRAKTVAMLVPWAHTQPTLELHSALDAELASTATPLAVIMIAMIAQLENNRLRLVHLPANCALLAAHQ